MSLNNKRWIYLAAGTLMLLFLGLIYGWSIFRAPLTGYYPNWSASQLSLTFTISMIMFCLGGFFSGLMLKKVSHRVLLAVAAVIGFVGFFCISTVEGSTASAALIKLYIFYGVLCGFAVGISYNSIIGTVNKWFKDKPGLASGAMLMGFGLGGIVLGGVVNVLIGTVGLFPTFKILAIGIFVVLMGGALILKAPTSTISSSDSMQKADGGNPELSKEPDGLKPSEMVRKRSFWLFFVWCLLLNSAGLMVINSAALIAVAFGAPAVLGLVVSVCNGVSRLFIGGMFDKYGRNITMMVNIGFTMTAGVLLLLGNMTEATIVIIIGLLFTGLGYGATPSAGAAFTNKEYGAKYFPINFSIGNFCLIPASIIGPMISSWLLDMSGGVYTGNFIMIIVLAVLDAIVFYALRRTLEKEKSMN